MIDVSVIIATHNRAELVSEAIESVLAQTQPVHEVIVVDDGSTDSTRQALARFGSRIRPVFQENQGASAARNHAMRLAQGRWLAFLDDDDVWLGTKIEKQAEIISRNPNLGLVYCSDYAVDHELHIMHERPALPENRGDVFEKLLINNFVFTSCVIARRDAVEEAGFMDPKLVFAQDWDLWLKIAAKYPVDFVRVPLVYYRHSPTGCLTRDIPAPNRIQEVEMILQGAQHLRPIRASTLRAANHRQQCRWAATWLQAGRQGKALVASLKAAGYEPLSWEGYRLAIHSLVPPGMKGALRKSLGRNGAFPGPRPPQVAEKSAAPQEAATFLPGPQTSSPGMAKASAGAANPPVIILNLCYSGLAIARDLAEHGIRAVGLSADPKCYGNFTRHCEVRLSPDSQEQPLRMAEYLLGMARELPGAVVFPTRDADILVLDQHRHDLESRFRLAIPPTKVLFRVLDKHALYQAAREAGVPVPRTIAIRSSADLSRVPAEIGFPCVLKPLSSVHWRQADHWRRVGARKAFLVHDAHELESGYAGVSDVHSEVLVQEWIPGGSSEIAILGGYVGDFSQPGGYFCARKVVQSPDDFGTGCLVETVDLPALLEPTMRLWRVLDYRGMAEVEYKWDERSREFKLIEINARHWDWYQLGRACGVDLTWIAYSDLTGKPIPPTHPNFAPTKWIAEPELVYSVARSIFRRELSLSELRRLISGRRMYGILDWKDPWPFLRYSVTVMLPSMVMQFLRRIKGGKKQP